MYPSLTKASPGGLGKDSATKYFSVVKQLKEPSQIDMLSSSSESPLKEQSKKLSTSTQQIMFYDRKRSPGSKKSMISNQGTCTFRGPISTTQGVIGAGDQLRKMTSSYISQSTIPNVQSSISSLNSEILAIQVPAARNQTSVPAFSNFKDTEKMH